MAVNESYYGAKDTWYNPGDRGLKYSRFGDTATTPSLKTFGFGYSQGIVKPREMVDNSVCKSALGTESDLCHIKYYKRTGDPYHTENFDTMPFCLCGRTGNYANSFAEYTASESETSPQIPSYLMEPYTYTSIANNNLFPLLDFDYKRMRGFIFVSAGDGTRNGARSFVSLEAYCDKDNAESYVHYPYIYNMGVRMYYDIGESDPAFVDVERNYTYPTDFADGMLVFNPLYIGKGIPVQTGEKLNDGYYLALLNNYRIGNMTGRLLLMGLIAHDYRYDFISGSTNRAVVAGDMEVRQDGNYRWWVKQYWDGFKEYAMRQVACLGFQFVLKSEDLNLPITNENVYMGVLDENYVGHGEFTHGRDNKYNEQYKLISANDSPYSPPDAPSPYSKETKSHKYTGTTYSLNTIYIDPAGLGREDALSVRDLIQAARAVPEDEIEKAGMYGQDPSQRLVRAWRLFAKDFVNTYARSTFKVGEYDTGAYAYHTQQSSPGVFDCGTVKVQRIHNNFLDFEPYTTVRVYAPFCGSIEIPPSFVMGHKVRLEESIHPHTGDIVANVFIDGIFYDSIKGNCAEEIGLSAEQSATFALAQHQYKYQALNGVIKTANAVAGGIAGSSIAASYGNTTGTYSQAISGALGAASGALEVGNNMYLAGHSSPAITQVTTSSPSVQYAYITEPYVLILSPKMYYNNEQLEKYKNVRGVPVAEARKLSQCSGFTQCSEIVLDGIDATSTEKEMIREMLRKGVIL